MLKDFYQYVDDGSLHQAEGMLLKLENEIGLENPIVVKARERLDLEIAFAED